MDGSKSETVIQDLLLALFIVKHMVDMLQLGEKQQYLVLTKAMCFAVLTEQNFIEENG